MKKYLLVVAAMPLLLVSMVGCTVNLTAVANDLDDLVITLERTACFGFCPVYTLTIYGNGTVIYEGEEFVETQGRVETTIDQEKMKQLVLEFEAVDYFSLNDGYVERTITCAPTVITSITIDEKTKTIEHYRGDANAPEVLTELEDKIDEIVNSKQWINSSSTNESQWVVAGSDDLLGKYEASEKVFEKLEIGDRIVYFHQRMIDDAIVEGDSIIYHFDKDTKEFLDKIIRWRSGLPEHMTLMVTKEQAESMVIGRVQFSKLYIISPESDVFPLEPTPDNPCWVVTSIDGYNKVITIIDAVNGEILNYGVPPPTS